MKFELKTENNNNSKSFSNIFRSFFILALIIILCDINFEKLSSLSKLKSKQKIWEFCKEVVK